MAQVVVRYFAAARAAAAASEDVVEAATIRECLSIVTATRGPEFERVLRVCTLLVDGVAVHDRDVQLGSPTEVDVLPPFAGG
jgi:molybdopterin synthase sulfur carrier subunit